MINIDLSEKTVMITGSGGDIGVAILKKFLKAGAKCVCLDKNNKRIKAGKLIKFFSNKIILINKNIENKSFVKSVSQELRKKKIRLDVLINNAGFTTSKNFLKYELKDWDKTLKINLTAPFLLSQQIAKNFMRSGGNIINITSLAAEQGFPDNVAYVSSKGGLKQLTKAMALDLSTKNIRVNSIGPGYVKTSMTKKSFNNKKKKKNRSERMILNRWAEPEDIANAAIFLGSDLANYINGQDLYVDGGWLSKGLKKDT